MVDLMEEIELCGGIADGCIYEIRPNVCIVEITGPNGKIHRYVRTEEKTEDGKAKFWSRKIQVSETGEIL